MRTCQIITALLKVRNVYLARTSIRILPIHILVAQQRLIKIPAKAAIKKALLNANDEVAAICYVAVVSRKA
jgi:hypothetical protein